MWIDNIRRRAGKAAAAGVLALTVTLTGGFLTVNAAEAPLSQGVLIDGTDVGGMSRDEVRAMVAEKISALSQTSITINIDDQQTSVTLGELGLSWANTEILDEASSLGTTGNIVQRYKDQKDLQVENKSYALTYTVDKNKVQAYAQSLASYNSEPVNATIYTTDELTPGVEGGTNGITVDAKKTRKAIRKAVSAWNGTDSITVNAAIESVEPEVTYDDLAIISDVLGQATTDYSASSAARAANVANGCSKISGTLLRPGESFSVTSALVPFSAENGYEQAPSYEENRVVDSYGGGICQVSTTLYNALLKAEVEIWERSNHTMVVSYVDLSKDAAIAEGVMDLQFYNNLEDPIYIVGYCYGGQISFIIYGHETRPANRTLEFESRMLSTIEPTDSKLYANTAQAVGYINQTQSPHTGYTAELWKNIYIDGVLSDSVQVNSSYYQAVGTIYDVGVATTNTALSAAMYTAIASGNIGNVQAVIANAATYTAQPETTAGAGTAGTIGTDASGNGAAGTDAGTGTAADGTAADDAAITVVQ